MAVAGKARVSVSGVLFSVSACSTAWASVAPEHSLHDTDILEPYNCQRIMLLVRPVGLNSVWYRR
jgi:hypothetical protein